MFLTADYWETLFRQLPSTETQVIESKNDYLLRYAVDGTIAMINQADFIRGTDFADSIDEIMNFYTSSKKSFTVTLYDYINSKKHAKILRDRGFVKQEVYQTLVAPVEDLISSLSTKKFPFKVKVVDYTKLLDEDHVKIMNDAFPDAYESYDQIREMIQRSNERTALDTRLELVNFVVYDAKKPVATAVLYINSDWDKVASLSGAAVLPDYQGQGIYTELLRARAELAAERGYTHLMTQADIKTSAPIVQSKGFTKVNEFTDYHYYLQSKN